MGDWILAIDFGSSYTTAAARIDGHAEIIEIDGDRRVPSVILLDQAGELVVGKAAENQALLSPGRVVREPKRLLGEPAPVVLGGTPYPISTLVGALLGYVYRRAVEHVGTPPSMVCLTHPATWRRPRLQILAEAAHVAGITDPHFLPEPIAAAITYGESTPDLPEGAHVAIYDLGGGTFDTAVLRWTAGRFSVIGRPGGDGRMGGEFFDELLTNYLGAKLPAAAWSSLQASEDTVWRQAFTAFRSDVRRAKEALSLQASTELLVGLPTGLERVQVTRAEFDDLIRPYLRETTEMLATTISDAGIDASTLAGIYLVGGASRTPLVEELVREAFPTIPVARRGDPKMVVALGATNADAPTAVTPPIAAGLPLAVGTLATGFPGQRTIAPMGSVAAAGLAGQRPPPDGGVISSTRHDPGPMAPPDAAVPRRRRRRLVAVVATLIVLALVAGVALAGIMALGPKATPGSDVAAATTSDSPSPSSSSSSSLDPSGSFGATDTPSASPDASTAGPSAGPTPRPPTATPKPPTAPPTAAPTPAPTPKPVPASMISPGNGATIGSSVVFHWSAAANVRYYSVYVGSTTPPSTCTSPGGCTAPSNAFASTQYSDVSGACTPGGCLGIAPPSTSVTVSGLPANGSKVYVRLFTKFEPASGPLYWRDYVYTSGP